MYYGFIPLPLMVRLAIMADYYRYFLKRANIYKLIFHRNTRLLILFMVLHSIL